MILRLSAKTFLPAAVDAVGLVSIPFPVFLGFFGHNRGHGVGERFDLGVE